MFAFCALAVFCLPTCCAGASVLDLDGLKAFARSRAKLNSPLGATTQQVPIFHRHNREEIDNFVKAVRECGRVPGVTVSVTSKDSTLHTSAAGVTNSAHPTQPVDNTTLFSIGSTTKAFTATATAILQDQNVVDWDDHARFIERMPFFRLNSSYANLDITPRDLACHRTGLSTADLIWVSRPNITRIDAVRKAVPLILPADKFRYRFLYNNWMFTALGSVVDAALAPQTWETFVRDNILQRAGMTQTKTSAQDAIATGNYASPHVLYNNQTSNLPDAINECLSIVGPAGAIASNALDMAKWIRVHLNQGLSPDTGERLVSAESLAVTQQPSMVATLDLGAHDGNGYLPNQFGVADITSDSGLGWLLGSYRGLREVWHGGRTLGHTTEVSFLPTAGFGVFVSVNQIGVVEVSIAELVKIFVFDTLLGVSPRGTNISHACQVLQDELSEYAHAPTTQTGQPLRARRGQPLPTPGRYENQAWGVFQVAEDSSSAALNTFTGTLASNGTSNFFSFTASGVWALVTAPGVPVADVRFVEGGLMWFPAGEATQYFFSLV